MKIAEAKRILKENGENREHSPRAIRAFVDVCDYWAIELAKHIEENMEGKARVYPKDVTSAFTTFLLYNGGLIG